MAEKLTNLVLDPIQLHLINGVVEDHTEDFRRFGEYVSGPRVVTPETKAEMKRILHDIQSGAFTSEWIRECKAGQPKFKATRRMNDAHPIEEVGDKLRGMMPWIKSNALVDKAKN